MSRTQQKKLQSIFPDLPRSSIVANNDGVMHADWYLGLSSLFQACQKNFSNEGWQLPILSQEDQDKIESLYNIYVGKQLPSDLPDRSGTIIFDDVNYGGTRKVKVFTILYDADKNIISASWVPL